MVRPDAAPGKPRCRVPPAYCEPETGNGPLREVRVWSANAESASAHRWGFMNDQGWARIRSGNDRREINGDCPSGLDILSCPSLVTSGSGCAQPVHKAAPPRRSAVTLGLWRVADCAGARAVWAGQADFTDSGAFAETRRRPRSSGTESGTTRSSSAGVPLRAACLAAAVNATPTDRLRIVSQTGAGTDQVESAAMSCPEFRSGRLQRQPHHRRGEGRSRPSPRVSVRLEMAQGHLPWAATRACPFLWASAKRRVGSDRMSRPDSLL